jgi:hypothetical protein
VIRGAVFCPHPPVLVPEVAQGAAGELHDLRAACRAAVRRIAGPGVRWIVLGAGPVTARHDATARGSLAGLGVPLEVPLGSDRPGPVELPLSLTVGAWLLRDVLGPNCAAVGFSVGVDGLDARIEDAAHADIALLVMGDGSARRSTAAPGYFDERAEAFDAGVAAALRSGEAGELNLDPVVGAELLAAGVPAWSAAAALLDRGEYAADLLYAQAPYGVGYFVAAWSADG